MTGNHHNLTPLFPPLQPCVHDTLRAPHQPITVGAADPITGTRGLLQKFQSDSADDAHEIGPHDITGIGRRGVRVVGMQRLIRIREFGSDAQRVNHIGSAVRTAIPQILGETREDPLGLRNAQRSRECRIPEAVEGIVEHGRHDVRLHHGFENVRVQCVRSVVGVVEEIVHPVRIAVFDTRADTSVEEFGGLPMFLLVGGAAVTDFVGVFRVFF
mmetsp:Transcript_18357/g.22471  ORF Transcript_18357/g.22471 Transcript_18357/m.22471 type:complete len:214 (-) Transcript_18357:11-652(-)